MSEKSGTSNGSGHKIAYATLLTRPTYLAGVIILAYSLHKHSPSTPLIIQYTPSTLPHPCIKALESESKHCNIILHPVEHLRIPPRGPNGTAAATTPDHGMVAERFADTWTKLRVFDIHALPQSFDYICFLDADTLVRRDPLPFLLSDESTRYLAGEQGRLRVLATHVCVCNLDADAWAPPSWTPQNCAYTGAHGADAVPEVRGGHETLAMFNSGVFVFRPSALLAGFVQSRFRAEDGGVLRGMKFPDQDFLNGVFAGRWRGVSWRVNALKTWRYWHAGVWTGDEEPAVVHYIVDKPWAQRVGRRPVQDGRGEESVAGYKGQDGVTHSWWWAEYEAWVANRGFFSASDGVEREVLGTVRKYVAGEEREERESEDEGMRAIGGGAQDYAKKWVSGVGRGRVLGERGHGPVVRQV
ncbi:nucleotide-diphospho-sugar transferase [Corynespora cassiicola Philippines]|uniref:Nucleotide-diphospho-sugar transferase n=1 Tax=Corynespora cassiicola Philippines TaxID=1448308 RepID=A0A2T2N473_CORCC|nr:nucleotide-diphospho-sugar transferase [Corynespora cassiicola Philippines]